MAYQLEITSRANECLVDIVVYLYYHVGGVGNPVAALKFLVEYEHALDVLTHQAESFGILSEKGLAEYGYRKIRFKTLHYKIFYRVQDENVIIDLITHDLQDYKSFLL